MEAAIRFGTFLAIFAVVALAEWRFPKRDRLRPRSERWRINIGILVFDVVAQRLTVGAAAFVTATYAREHGWGLFNWLDWPSWIEGLLAFLMLDFAIYLQHVMSHALPLFWRLHQVHHADLDVDLTTGIRFHPAEIIISSIYKAAVVAALGVDPWIVIVFEAVLNASAVYTHGNVRLPHRLDATCAGRSARRTCTASTTRPSRRRPTPISASSCPSGTAPAAPCGSRRRRVSKASSSVFRGTGIRPGSDCWPSCCCRSARSSEPTRSRRGKSEMPRRPLLRTSAIRRVVD